MQNYVFPRVVEYLHEVDVMLVLHCSVVCLIGIASPSIFVVSMFLPLL